MWWRDQVNGRLVSAAHYKPFVEALEWIASRSPAQRLTLDSAARETAERFSMPRQARRALRLYESLLPTAEKLAESLAAWTQARRRIEAEWTLWSNLAHAATPH